MKRRQFLGACAALLTFGRGGTHGSALEISSGQNVVGCAVQDDFYDLYYRSDLCLKDLPHPYYYSDSFFEHSALEYDHELAKVSFALSVASSATVASDKYWGVDGFVGREANLADAFEKLGFSDAQFPHHDENMNHTEDTTAWAIAQKTVVKDGSRKTIFAVVVRSAGYGAKWVSNFHAGDGGAHIGFIAATEQFVKELKEYLQTVSGKMALGEVSLWMTSYSRGAAIANLAAAQLEGILPGLTREHIYVYTFATPATITKADHPELQRDYDHNHDADGRLKETWDESNIFNLVSSADLVAQMFPEQWGYHRNGNDRFLPTSRIAQELEEQNERGREWSPPMVFSKLGTKEDSDRMMQTLFRICPDWETYVEKYEDVLRELFQCLLYCPADLPEIEDVMDPELVWRRLTRVDGIGRFSEKKLKKSCEMATQMTRPMMGVLEKEVPLWVQINVAPTLAVGLCYDLKKELLLGVLSYALMTLRVHGEWDDILQCGYRHYAENYITMLDYYDPEEHGMEPYTKSV